MATIYAYIEDGYAVFRNAANEVFNTVPAAELSITTDAVQNVYFVHRRDAFAVAPFNSISSVPPQQFAQAAPNEILRKNGTQYTALLTFDDFWTVWQVENPLNPAVTVTSPDLADIKAATESTALSSADIKTATESTALSSADIKTATESTAQTLAAAFPDDGRTSVDAFGRTVSVQPQTIFDSKQVLDNRPLDWYNNTVSGSVAFTYQQNRASTNLGVSVGVAGVGVRQTKRRFNYQTGKCSEFIITGKLGAYQAGITKRIGGYDNNNGVFFELSPAGTAGLKIVIRSFVTGAPIDTRVHINDWDNQPIAALLDVEKVQIFWIDFAWLGVGAVRFGVYIDGQKYVLHTVKFANVASSVWASVPNFPVRYEIQNDGTGGDSDLEAMCASVKIYGGRQSLGYKFAASRSVAMTTNNDALFYPIAAIRLKSTAAIATLKIDRISIICTSNAAYIWRLLLNPTVVGTALAYTGVANSAAEVDIVSLNTTTVTGGTEIASGVSNQGAGVQGVEIVDGADFALGTDAAGVSDVLVLAVSRIAGTGTTETFFAALNWREEV